MINNGKIAPEDVWQQNVLLPYGNSPTVYDLFILISNSINDIKDSVVPYDEVAGNFETFDTKQWLSEYHPDIDPREIAKLPLG